MRGIERMGSDLESRICLENIENREDKLPKQYYTSPKKSIMKMVSDLCKDLSEDAKAWGERNERILTIKI